MPSKARSRAPWAESWARNSPGKSTSEAKPPAPLLSLPLAAQTAAWAATAPANSAGRPLAPTTMA